MIVSSFVVTLENSCLNVLTRARLCGFTSSFFACPGPALVAVGDFRRLGAYDTFLGLFRGDRRSFLACSRFFCPLDDMSCSSDDERMFEKSETDVRDINHIIQKKMAQVPDAYYTDSSDDDMPALVYPSDDEEDDPLVFMDFAGVTGLSPDRWPLPIPPPGYYRCVNAHVSE